MTIFAHPDATTTKHNPEFVNNLEHIKGDYFEMGKNHVCLSNGFPHLPLPMPEDWVCNIDRLCRDLNLLPRPHYKFSYGGHFAVSKERLWVRPLQFWSECLNMLRDTSRLWIGQEFERVWRVLLDVPN
jgi:hypothetical protein